MDCPSLFLLVGGLAAVVLWWLSIPVSVGWEGGSSWKVFGNEAQRIRGGMTKAMELSRRDFIKLSGVTTGGLLLPAGFAASAAATPALMFPLHKAIGEAATVCPYCSCGCGMLIATGADGHIVNSEGDPDAINNRGALDPKSISVLSLSQKDRGLTGPLFGEATSVKLVEVGGPWGIVLIGKRIWVTRDGRVERS